MYVGLSFEVQPSSEIYLLEMDICLLMIMRISLITVVVKDQEEALQWYIEKLGFEKRTDQRLGEGFRWLTVALPEQKDVAITLADWRWYGDRTQGQIGENTTVVLESTNCREDCKKLRAKGVRFTGLPKEEPWGISAVFLDLYGNPYNLLERKAGM